MYAVAQFYSDGSCFPVELNIGSGDDAARLRNWMHQGPSAAEDWRVVRMDSLRDLLEQNRVHLECFTAEAQVQKRRQIMEAGA